MNNIRKFAKKVWRRMKIELTWLLDERVIDAINDGCEYEEVVALVERIADGKEHRNA